MVSPEFRRVYRPADSARERVRSFARLKALHGPPMNHAEAHEGRYPDSFEQLKGPGNEELLGWASENVQYFAKGETKREHPQRPLAYDRTLLEKTGGTNVLFNDGHVEFVPAKQLKAIGKGYWH